MANITPKPKPTTILMVDRGTTYSIVVNYKKDGVATTLVGATVRFTMKSVEWDDDDTDTDADVVKNVTTGNSGGIATIVLVPADTAELEPRDYYFDVKVKESGGAVYKILEGRVRLDGSPTNRLT